jgi:DNA-binding beta-propeller fold protein YncE
VVRSPDGLMYVCDRSNNRVQEFEVTPNSVRFLREVVVAPGSAVGSAADVAFSPCLKYMYVLDQNGMRIWSIDRETFEVLGWANAAPETEGDDNIGINRIPVHHMAVMPNGDLLVTRTRKGVQVMRFLGVS